MHQMVNVTQVCMTACAVVFFWLIFLQTFYILLVRFEQLHLFMHSVVADLSVRLKIIPKYLAIQFFI